MTYLSLRWRIQIVMCVISLGLLATVVYGADSLPVPMNYTTIGLLVCGAFLISILIGMAWHWHSIHRQD